MVLPSASKIPRLKSYVVKPKTLESQTEEFFAMASNQSPPSETPAATESSSSDPPAEPRRSFVFEIASIVIGGLVGVVPLLVGVFSFLDPLTRTKKKPLWYAQGGESDNGFVRISSLGALEEDGEPQRFPVIADKQDAWNYIPNQPIGAVFVQRLADNQVLVFNATCPHAGCSVSCIGKEFHCPCHNSAFAQDGSKLVSESGRNNPSPRPLDSLEVDPRRLENDQEVWVKFQNFYTGKHEKKPKS
jgi:menaquinol-cytochrome c reductase iron-sulfur subunit